MAIRGITAKSCDKTFSPLTGTVFDSKKIPISEWIEYLIHLFEFHSITTSARDKLAVAVAFDNHAHLIIKVENTSKPSDRSACNAWLSYKTRISSYS